MPSGSNYSQNSGEGFHPFICRSLELLHAIAYNSDQALQQMLEAGTVPVITNVVTAYADSVQRASALQPDADPEAGEAGDGPSSDNSELFNSVSTPRVVLAALSLCQVRCLVCATHFVSQFVRLSVLSVRLSLHQLVYLVVHCQLVCRAVCLPVCVLAPD